MQATKNGTGGVNVILEEHESDANLAERDRKYLASRCRLVKIIRTYIDVKGREYTITQWARRGQGNRRAQS